MFSTTSRGKNNRGISRLHCLIALCALAPLTGFAATWISPTDRDWPTEANWSGNNVPNDNSEVAIFNAPGLANPRINSNITINSISASTSLTLSGDDGLFMIDANMVSDEASFTVTNNAHFILDRDVTTINSPQSITARVKVSAGSTFTFAVGNTWTSNHGIAFQDVALSNGGTFNFNGALVLGDNFFQVFNHFTTADGGVVNFKPASVTAGPNSQIQNLGGKGRLNLLADFAASKIVLGGNAFSPINGPSETYLAANGLSMSRPVQIQLSNSIGPTSSVHQYGVDIPDAGTATQAGNFTLGSGGLPGDNYKIALDVKTDDTMIVTGKITGGGATRTNVTQVLAKTGPGVLRLEGSAINDWVGNFNIEQGLVVLDKTAVGINAISDVRVTISAGAALALGNTDQIADAADLVLAGGTFDTAGFDETLDQLTILQSSSIIFGNGESILTFSGFANGSGTLAIYGWSGSLLGGGTDQFKFIDPTNIAPYLANISFAGHGAGAQLVGNEVVPLNIPEPSSALLLAVGAGVFLRRRRGRADR